MYTGMAPAPSSEGTPADGRQPAGVSAALRQDVSKRKRDRDQRDRATGERVEVHTPVVGTPAAPRNPSSERSQPRALGTA